MRREEPRSSSRKSDNPRSRQKIDKTDPRPPTASDERRARKAKLKYLLDSSNGIRRKRVGKSFVYVDAHGKAVRTRKTLDRIESIVIPPAWKEVWISPISNGHLQATGIDAAGRKQYRYHDRWQQVQDDAKYERLIQFAHALPRIHRRVAADLKRRGLPRRKVLAGVVRLLETTLIRVGNEEYANSNHSYGLTTMRNRHVDVKGSKICFDFKGKSGVDHEITLEDPRLAHLVRECQDLPGQELFQYVDEEGTVQDVGSTDVNDYLRSISGGDFTAKDFRTWAGTAMAAQALSEFEDFNSKTAAQRNIRKAIEQVAKRLGNTTAVCKKSYIHPAIFEAYMDRSLAETLRQRAEHAIKKSLHQLTPEEAAVLTLLQKRMSKHAR